MGLASGFDFDAARGAVHEGDVRYVLMRPDVLMGIGRAMPDFAAFLTALEESAFRNARASFESYRTRGLMDEGDFLVRAGAFAARLGWGAWEVRNGIDGALTLVVRDSPFAAGAGASPIPVCAPIAGVIRALYLTYTGEEVDSVERACVAQGHAYCQFPIEHRS